LDGGGGAPGRRRALSPGSKRKVSVASCVARRRVEFSHVASQTEHGEGVTARGGAGRRWRRDVGSMPCQRA
jgi:hypothetical protein